MNDFSDLNNLSTEAKMIIVNAQALVDETKSTVKNKQLYLDLTSSMQLKSDCKDIERRIKEIQKGKNVEKNLKMLEVNMIKLRTNLNGIVNFYERT